MNIPYGLSRYTKNIVLGLLIMLPVAMGILLLLFVLDYIFPQEGETFEEWYALLVFQLIANLIFNTVGSILLSVVHTHLVSRLKSQLTSVIIRKSILYALLLGIFVTILVYFVTVGLLIFFIPGALVYGWVIGRKVAKNIIEQDQVQENK